MPHQISRRNFGKLVLNLAVAASAGGITYTYNRPSAGPAEIFSDLHTNYTNPFSVIDTFTNADTSFLMATYSVFFPEFLRTTGFDAVNQLQKAKADYRDKTVKNPHRLDALPAASAAHLLSWTTRPDVQKTLSETVVDTLHDPRREVKEIVLQNLIASAGANVDTYKYFAADPDIVLAIQDTVYQALSDTSLLSPAVLGAEFLLNAEALLKNQPDNSRVRRKVSSTLDWIFSTQEPHFMLLHQLIKRHRRIFVANPTNIDSLPPQQSEMLMGWRNFSARTYDYISILALTKARLALVNYDLVQGDKQTSEASNPTQARNALPKTIGFINAFDLMPIIDANKSEARMESNEFYQFISDTLPEMVARPERFGFSSDECQLDEKFSCLRSAVPFARKSDFGLVKEAIRNKRYQDTSALFNAFGVAGGSLSLLHLIPYLRRLFCEGGDVPHGRPSRQVDAEMSVDTINEAKEQIRERHEKIDRGEYEGLEAQQRERGDLELS